MTTEYTTNFRLAMPDFRMGPWHDLLNTNASMIDGLLYSALSNSNVLPWENSTAYTPGISVIDSADATVWVCVEGHTSPALPTTFAADRAAHPTRWTQLLAGFAPRGEWLNSTNYFPYDLSYSSHQGIFAICTTRHTSNVSGTIKDDEAYWTFLVDMSSSNLSAAAMVTYDNSVSAIPRTNVQEALDYIDSVNDGQAGQIIALNNVNISQGSRLDAIEGLNTTQDSRLSSVEGVNNTQNTNISNLQTRMTAAESALASAAIFPSGTKMLFGNAAVPSGWTRDTSIHDRALRIVGAGNGGVAGGSVGFSSIFNKTTVGARAITVAQMPAHDHFTGIGTYWHDPAGPAYDDVIYDYYSGSPTKFIKKDNAIVGQGGNQGHDHDLELRLAYYDMILGTKN